MVLSVTGADFEKNRTGGSNVGRKTSPFRQQFEKSRLTTNYPMDNCNKASKVSMIPFLILIKI
jgi:hypothetical protein